MLGRFNMALQSAADVVRLHKLIHFSGLKVPNDYKTYFSIACTTSNLIAKFRLSLETCKEFLLKQHSYAESAY